MEEEIIIRKAERNDCQTIRNMIQRLDTCFSRLCVPDERKCWFSGDLVMDIPSPLCSSYSQELADFEKMSHGPEISYKDLERDGFDTEPPRFTCYIATIKEKAVGFTLFYDSYSPWGGKFLLLEELYVTEKYRNRNIGSMLFDKVAKIAYDEKYYKLEFVVLNWNPAQDFYKRKGVKDVTVTEKWHLYRMDRLDIKQLCEKS